MCARGGRSYIVIAERPAEDRPTALRSKSSVWLLGPTLDTLSSSARLPTRSSVQLYLQGRMVRSNRGMKPEEVISCPRVHGTRDASCRHPATVCLRSGDLCVVEAIKQDSWYESKLPMVNDEKIKVMVKNDFEEFVKRRKDKSRISVSVIKKRRQFQDEMKKVLNIASPDAVEDIMKDSVRSKVAKEEDVLFLKDQLSERRFTVGKVDLKYVKKVEDNLKKKENFGNVKPSRKRRKNCLSRRRLWSRMKMKTKALTKRITSVKRKVMMNRRKLPGRERESRRVPPSMST